MNNLISYLRRRKIDSVFAGLGLDFEHLFPAGKMDADRAPYTEYEWIVKIIPRFNTIVNAVPPEDRIEELPWEEWYRFEHSTYHHVLYLQKPPIYNEIFEAPEKDNIHPVRTLGKRWYVINDRDMRPVLLR